MATQPDFFLYDRIGRLATVIEVRTKNLKTTRTDFARQSACHAGLCWAAVFVVGA